MGESFKLLVQPNAPGALYQLPPFTDALVYVAGFYLGSSQQPIGRRDFEDSASSWMYRVPRPSGSFTANQPGPLTIRFVYWIVIRTPRNTNQLDFIQWQHDGSPLLPPDTTWSKRIEIKKTITVTAAR